MPAHFTFPWYVAVVVVPVVKVVEAGSWVKRKLHSKKVRPPEGESIHKPVDRS